LYNGQDMVIDNKPATQSGVRRPLPVQVREAIEEEILMGVLREGDQIVEYQVARQMGISQTPVREALRTLERDGLVVTRPHRGTFVRRVTRREAAERYSLGMELEAFAARLALPKLTEADFRHLERLIDEMAAAAGSAQSELRGRSRPQGAGAAPAGEDAGEEPGGAGGDGDGTAFARTVELNVAFHRYLVERADHELLLKAWLAVNPLNWRFVTYTRLLNPDPVELAERHRMLLAVYRLGDQVLASSALRQHIWEVAEKVLPNMPDDAPAGAEPVSVTNVTAFKLGGAKRL
jgi:DNA-binding GntR family transcriptional regulator